MMKPIQHISEVQKYKIMKNNIWEWSVRHYQWDHRYRCSSSAPRTVCLTEMKTYENKNTRVCSCPRIIYIKIVQQIFFTADQRDRLPNNINRTVILMKVIGLNFYLPIANKSRFCFNKVIFNLWYIYGKHFYKFLFYFPLIYIYYDIKD